MNPLSEQPIELKIISTIRQKETLNVGWSKCDVTIMKEHITQMCWSDTKLEVEGLRKVMHGEQTCTLDIFCHEHAHDLVEVADHDMSQLFHH